MQGTDDFDADGYLAGRFQFAETLVAGGDYLGEVLVQGEGADIGQEGGECCSADSDA